MVKQTGQWETLLSFLSFLFTGTVGLIGNVLSIVILSKPDMYNSFNQLLIGLSTMDSIFIVLAILDYSFARYKFDTKWL